MNYLTPDEQEQLDERVAIIMEGAALNESDAHKLAMESVVLKRIRQGANGREQARELVARLRQ